MFISLLSVKISFESILCCKLYFKIKIIYDFTLFTVAWTVSSASRGSENISPAKILMEVSKNSH